MDKCLNCTKCTMWSDCYYCQDTGHLLPIDDIDCDYEEDKGSFDVQTEIERNKL